MLFWPSVTSHREKVSSGRFAFHRSIPETRDEVPIIRNRGLPAFLLRATAGGQATDFTDIGKREMSAKPAKRR